MNIQALCNYTVSLFSERILPSLTAQQKRVAIVASLIFGLFLATLYVGKNWGESKVTYFTGHGNFTSQNGAVVDGNFKDGWLHGKGKVTYLNGEIWEGDFQFHKLNGPGKKTYSAQDGKPGKVDEGTFKDGVLV